MKLFYLFLSLLLLNSCSRTNNNISEGLVTSNQIKYAKGFALETKSGITFIDVYDPWNDGQILTSYKLGHDSLQDGLTLTIPAERLTCLSSTYLGMISMLDAREKVIATSNANWIYDSILYKQYLNGEIIDLGNDMSISAEAVISQKPDVVLKYIYQSADPIDPIIEGSGIPVVYIIEFMEEHPLGRAEWIKLIGTLLNKQKEADSVFNVIEKNYNYYTKIASESASKPSVLCGSIYKGTWYAPGGGSFIAQLLRDANADYYWYSDSTSGSLSLALETIIQHQKDADYWINANTYTLNELVAIEPRSDVFKAYREGNVFHYNKRINANGGLDYYETGVIRPDLLLKDLITILHPGVLNDETIYYRNLE